jgi:hypothetical protein
MLTVERKLARWRALYGELCSAEERLRLARASGWTGGPATVRLDREVDDLRQRCDAALGEVGSALAASRAAASASLPSSPPG